MPILASRLLGASLAFSGYRGAPIVAWVSPLSKLYASTDIKKKKKKKKTRDLAHLGQQIRNRQDLYGQDNVAVGWVKAHVGIEGNERADEMAKMGAAKEGRDHVTEGGL